MSQEKLGKLAGVTKDTIYRVERGKSCDLATAQGIAKALGSTVSYLFPTGIDGPNVASSAATLTAAEEDDGMTPAARVMAMFFDLGVEDQKRAYKAFSRFLGGREPTSEEDIADKTAPPKRLGQKH